MAERFIPGQTEPSHRAKYDALPMEPFLLGKIEGSTCGDLNWDCDRGKGLNSPAVVLICIPFPPFPLVGPICAFNIMCSLA